MQNVHLLLSTDVTTWQNRVTICTRWLCRIYVGVHISFTDTKIHWHVLCVICRYRWITSIKCLSYCIMTLGVNVIWLYGPAFYMIVAALYKESASCASTPACLISEKPWPMRTQWCNSHENNHTVNWSSIWKMYPATKLHTAVAQRTVVVWAMSGYSKEWKSLDVLWL